MKWTRYILAFVITSAIFGTALALSTYLNNTKINEIRSIEDTMSVDILSLETQFDLLSELSCKQITRDSVLSPELAEIGQKLSFMEDSLGTENEEVVRLKRRYSLLQIKDYLLMQKVTEKCDISPEVILYFYSNEGDCDDCKKQGYVLTKLLEDNQGLRVYAFDAHLDLSALETLVSIHNIGDTLPALIIKDDLHVGYMSLEDIYALLPHLKPQEKSVSSTTEPSEND